MLIGNDLDVIRRLKIFIRGFTELRRWGIVLVEKSYSEESLFLMIGSGGWFLCMIYSPERTDLDNSTREPCDSLTFY